MAAIDRAPWNALVDDDGSNLVGTPWTKDIVKTVLLDPIDAAIATLAPIGGNPNFGSISIGLNPATTGAVRLANNTFIVSRNGDNTADVPLLGLNAANVVLLASGGQETLIGGNAIVLGNIKTAPAAIVYWSSRTQLLAPGVAQLTLQSDVANIGVVLDFATDGVLKILNRARSDYADLTCAKITAYGPVRIGPAGATATAVPGDLVVARSATTGAVYFGNSAAYIYWDGTTFNLTGGLTPNGARDLGSPVNHWNNLYVESISIGTLPATTGAIRLPNNVAMYARNAANSADLPILYYDTSDRLVLGYAGQSVIPYSINQDFGVPPGGAATWRQGFFSGGVAIGTVPAQGGALRLTNQQYISSRNGAGTADIFLLGLHSDNAIYMGSSGCLAVAPYAAATMLGMGSSPWAGLVVASTGTVQGGEFLSTGINGYRAPDGGGFYWASKTFLACPAVGQLVLENTLGSIGVGLDFATDTVLKVRNRALTAYADIIVGTLTLDAAYFRFKDRGFLQATSDGVFSLANYAGTNLTSFSPTTDTTGSLGAPGARWNGAYISGFLAMGGNMASAGLIRLPQAGYVYSRNAANTGDIFVIGCGVGGDDVVYVGHPGSVLSLRGTTITASGAALMPSGDNATNLGAPANRWGHLYIAGTLVGGAVAVAGGITGGSDVKIPDVAWYMWQTRGALGAIAVDKIALLNVNNTSGVGLDFSTDGTLKIRTRTHAADGNLSAATFKATGGPNVGDLRLPKNGNGITFTDAAGTGYQYALYTDSANNILLGDHGTGGGTAALNVIVRATALVWMDKSPVAIGALPASQGTLRLPNAGSIYARNAANSGDFRLLELTNGNIGRLGDPNLSLVVYGQLLMDPAALLSIQGPTMFYEMAAAPGAPGAGAVTVFARNTGGKTELIAYFNGGGVVRLAIQP
jgi:hypothetical protein